MNIWVMHPSSLIHVQPCLDIVASIWPIFPLIPFFFNSTFTKIIRKIFRLKVKKKKTDLSLPSFELQLKQGYQYMYIYICLPGIKDLVKIQYFSLMYHSQQPTWDTYNSGILSLNFAVLLFRISSRIPPLVGGREFLDFTMVKVLTFSWCLKLSEGEKHA